MRYPRRYAGAVQSSVAPRRPNEAIAAPATRQAKVAPTECTLAAQKTSRFAEAILSSLLIIDMSVGSRGVKVALLMMDGMAVAV